MSEQVTNGHIRFAAAIGMRSHDAHVVGPDDPGAAVFDRWLAEHDAQVRAEAVAEFIAWADSSPAVTWAGKGGIKDRWAER